MQIEEYLFFIRMVARPISKSDLGMTLPQKSQAIVGCVPGLRTP